MSFFWLRPIRVTGFVILKAWPSQGPPVARSSMLRGAELASALGADSSMKDMRMSPIRSTAPFFNSSRVILRPSINVPLLLSRSTAYHLPSSNSMVQCSRDARSSGSTTGLEELRPMVTDSEPSSCSFVEPLWWTISFGMRDDSLIYSAALYKTL